MDSARFRRSFVGEEFHVLAPGMREKSPSRNLGWVIPGWALFSTRVFGAGLIGYLWLDVYGLPVYGFWE